MPKITQIEKHLKIKHLTNKTSRYNMSNQEKPMDHLEGLAVISSMIRNTQGNFQQSSFYFILWGVIVAMANLGHYYLMVHTSYAHPYIVWLVTIPAWIITGVYAHRQKNLAKVTTVLDKVIGIIWITFGVSIFLLIIPGNIVHAYFNPIILLMTAIPTMVSGYIIKEKSLMVGAFVLWILGSISFFVAQEIHYLIAATAITICFVIPGLIMRDKKK